MKLARLLLPFLLICQCASALPELGSSASSAPSFYKQKAQWRHIIDSTWGKGPPLAEKLALFDAFTAELTQSFSCFRSLGLDWDSLKSATRSKIDSSTSRGRFAAIMGRLAWNLRDFHTWAIDTPVILAPLRPGTPVLNLIPFCSAESFGAVLTVLPDSTAAVLRAVPNHPLGLSPGDVILGYEGVPWKTLVRELLDAEIPMGSPGCGARSAQTHALMRAVGSNWHLFDSIDVLKYSTRQVQHLPVAPLAALPSEFLFANEQQPIPGIASAYCGFNPRSLFDPTMPRKPVAFGWLPGTEIGYIQVVVEWQTLADDQFLTAYTALKDSKGLIIDMRWNVGGWSFFNATFAKMFSRRTVTIEDAVRSGSDLFTLVPSGNSDIYAIPGNAGALYEHPIAVLLGPTCVSMGDLTAQRLRYHPMVRFFGKPPIASIGSSRSFPAPGDWVISYTYADAFHVSRPGEYLNRSEFPIDEPVWF
ncbi:MAG: S41 family peptidase, partial [Acidobacteriota bacterium]